MKKGQGKQMDKAKDREKETLKAQLAEAQQDIKHYEELTVEQRRTIDRLHRKLGVATSRLRLIAANIVSTEAVQKGWSNITQIQYDAAGTLKQIGEIEP